MGVASQSHQREQKRGLRRNEQKWTPALMDAGWTLLPSVILERQQALGLDATDINILLHLIRHWWYSDNLPRPSKRAIAECMGVDVSTIRKRIARMEGDGLIKRVARHHREHGQQSNSYDLSGLIETARPYAAESIAAREQRRREAAQRRTRKAHRLKVAGGTDGE